ncbi:MAG TPA: hypothetical protein VGF17_06475 [Phytomonospora sp.]
MAIYSEQTSFDEPVDTTPELLARLIDAEGTMSTERLTALAYELGVRPSYEHPDWNVQMLFKDDGTEVLEWHRIEERPLTPEEIEEEHREHPHMPR